MRGIVTIAVLLAISLNVSSAVDFDCTFGIRWHDYVGNVYECAVLSLDAKNIEKVTSVSGTHQLGNKNSDVVTLRINYQNLEFFPVDIETFFPNLKVLSLYGNSITEVKNAHLAPFPNLVYLNLYTNKITSLDGNLFDGLNSMQYVSFERNQISHVGHDLALPRTGLVYFEANPCINMRASTPDQIAALRFNLLINCTLTAPIEAALESRQNLLTNLGEQVQNLVERWDNLEQGQCELMDEFGNPIIFVINQNEVCAAIGRLKLRLAQTDYAIENIVASIRDLLDRNANLERRLECLEKGTEGKCVD